MADVKPFRGIHYDTGRVPDLSLVVTPPYDVISPEEQEGLHRRHPRNIVHIDFGKSLPGDVTGQEKYARAGTWLREWLDEGTLVRDPAPCFYYYEQEFAIEGKGTFVRKGFLGALKLSPFGEGVVFPHERTHAGPKRDRLALVRATDAHMSPVFGLFSDPGHGVVAALRAAISGPPDLAATDDLRVSHRVWKVADPGTVRDVAGKMADRKIFIADGHHRYETALAFRDEMRARHGENPAASFEHVLAFLCDMDDEGIVILPTHRGVHSLPAFPAERFLAQVREHVPVVTAEGGPMEALKGLEEAGKRGKSIAWLTGGGRFHLASFPDPERFCAEHMSEYHPLLRSLDVILLHGFLFQRLLGIQPAAVDKGEHVKYYKDPVQAAGDLSSGAVQAVFFLNPVTIPEFREVSLSGQVLPQKTTFFYPKIGTGLLIFPVGAQERVPG